MFDFQPPSFGREAKTLFRLDEDFVNLNHGSFGTLPSAVYDACDALGREIEKNPDHFMRQELYNRIDSARELLAGRLGVKSDTCVFLPNVSAALNTVLRNFDWTTADVIVHTDVIFESAKLSIEALQKPRKSVFTLPFPPSKESTLNKFRDHLRLVKSDRGKVVAVFESITATPAILLPWKEMTRICHEEGVWSVIDAAHSLGQEVDLNVAEADPDFWMTNCSKWSYSKRGCAVLYAPYRNQTMIKSTLTPALIYPIPDKEISDFVAKFYWHGSADPVTTLSVEYAIRYRDHIGGEKKIIDYCHHLALTGGRLVADVLGTEIIDSIEARGEMVCNMVNIALPLPEHLKPSGSIYVKFQELMINLQKIFAPIFYYQGRWWVRASAQIYNDMDDFRRLGSVLSEVCKILEESS